MTVSSTDAGQSADSSLDEGEHGGNFETDAIINTLSFCVVDTGAFYFINVKPLGACFMQGRCHCCIAFYTSVMRKDTSCMYAFHNKSNHYTAM